MLVSPAVVGTQDRGELSDAARGATGLIHLRQPTDGASRQPGSPTTSERLVVPIPGPRKITKKGICTVLYTRQCISPSTSEYPVRTWREGQTMASRLRRQFYCRCGTHLAKDNAERQCARCQRASRDKLIAPPPGTAGVLAVRPVPRRLRRAAHGPDRSCLSHTSAPLRGLRPERHLARAAGAVVGAESAASQPDRKRPIDSQFGYVGILGLIPCIFRRSCCGSGYPTRRASSRSLNRRPVSSRHPL